MIRGLMPNHIRRMLLSTSQPINITAELQPEEFVAKYTVPQFRLEYLGIIFVHGSRAHLLGPTENTKERDDYIRETFHCCYICLQLAHELAPVNDVMVWLTLEVLMLATNVFGDSGKT